MLSGSKVVVFWQVCSNIWQQNTALLVKKFWENFICQNPFLTILRLKKKIPMATKLKALVAGPLEKNFFAAFLSSIVMFIEMYILYNALYTE